MTTPTGIAHCIKRLRRCETLPALAARWSSLGKEYQHNDEVTAVKEQMKRELSNG